MIIQRLFSRHTPKGLIKYKNYNDEDLEKMTKGEKLRAIEIEDATAAKNSDRYAIKKIKKHAGIGALGGAALGAALGRKGDRIPMALATGLVGGVTGVVTGDARGRYIADKEGHNRDKRALSLARKIDRFEKSKGRDDDFEVRTKDRIMNRQAMQAARDARNAATMAYINTI